jgi:hypothetical protein
MIVNTETAERFAARMCVPEQVRLDPHLHLLDVRSSRVFTLADTPYLSVIELEMKPYQVSCRFRAVQKAEESACLLD